MHHSARMSGVVSCLVLIMVSMARAQEDPTAAEEAKAWQARRLAEFEAYEVVLASPQEDVPVKFERASVLSWSNPIRKTAAGAVFLWTIDGRPQMIASTYPYENGIEQELTSLSESLLILRGDKTFMHRFTPGIEWKEISGTEPPHKQRALRLTQMRRIAERFHVQGGNQRKFDARLLPQPIFRSPAETKVDTAVFAFVQGTDPEAVLMIEPTNKPGWRYALARMTTVPISADLDDEQVWELPACWNTRLADEMPFHTIPLPGAK